MRLRRKPRRWIAAAVVLVLVAAGVRLLDRASPIDYYRVLDDHDLALGSDSGPGAWTRVTSVNETPTTVTITVNSFLVRLGPGSAVGIAVESVAKLQGPIGGRTVIDGSTGLPIVQTRCLPPAYLAPGCT